MFQRSRAARAMLGDLLLLALCLAAFLLALLLPIIPALAQSAPLSPEETRLAQAYARSEVIRLHVLADDDTPEAQALKLLVRDALLKAFGAQLASASTTDADAVYTLLLEQADHMQSVALACARQNGFAGEVHTEVGVLRLPAKAYGQVVLPAGDYRALRVTLGSGQGQNWWCVLFPQLCLALSDDSAQPVDAPAEASDVSWSSTRIFRHWLVWEP